jgi:hypothetical protein
MNSLTVWKNSCCVASLQVVDHQQVDRAQPRLERVGVLVAQRLHKFEHEALGGHVDRGRGRIRFQERMADRVHQVGLALARAGMEVERAEARGARLGHCLGRVAGHAIRRIDHEAVEGEARVELRALGGRCRGGRDRCRIGSRRSGRRAQDTLRFFRQRLDRHTAHRRNLAAEFEQQPLGIVILDPLGHERRGQAQAHDLGIAAFDQDHRLEPLVEQALARRAAQVRTHMRPSLRNRSFHPVPFQGLNLSHRDAPLLRGKAAASRALIRSDMRPFDTGHPRSLCDGLR